MVVLRWTALLIGLLAMPVESVAQSSALPPSRCLAVAQAAPKLMTVGHTALPQSPIALPVQERADAVRIRFIGHSMFLLESPEGVRIATDYFGPAVPGGPPDVVTMNRAHSTHFTDYPDPAITHVLRGWNPQGGPADHHLQVGDVVIRSVPTDIRALGAGRISDGNSIFIFEMAGLCMGHLGHLHHVLSPEDLAWLGQLDVVMVAVDGSYTMSHAEVAKTLDVIKARLVLPMHYFGGRTLREFLGHLGEDYTVEISSEPEVVVSAATLPRAPKVLVLPGY